MDCRRIPGDCAPSFTIPPHFGGFKKKLGASIDERYLGLAPRLYDSAPLRGLPNKLNAQIHEAAYPQPQSGDIVQPGGVSPRFAHHDQLRSQPQSGDVVQPGGVSFRLVEIGESRLACSQEMTTSETLLNALTTPDSESPSIFLIIQELCMTDVTSRKRLRFGRIRPLGNLEKVLEAISRKRTKFKSELAVPSARRSLSVGVPMCTEVGRDVMWSVRC